MTGAERAVTFGCESDTLVGILHLPKENRARVGVVIVVGGPQYRVGSHRQFVSTARHLASAGYPVLRFDYRGMGDSTGEGRSFERVDADIRAAIDVLHNAESGLDGVVLYGLCDAASAILMYGCGDSRVRGLVILNPWVRTAQTESKAFVKHYYGQRLLQRAFWSKLLRGELAISRTLRGLVANLTKVWLTKASQPATADGDFIARMLAGLQGFAGPVLSLISERDLTAKEFLGLCQSSPQWRAALSRNGVRRIDLATADHTFSAPESLKQANIRTVTWLTELSANR